MSEWKEYRFTEAATLTNGRAYLQPELQEAGKYKIVRVGNLSGGDNWFYSDLELPEDKYCHKGDLLYAWACSFGPYIWNEDKTIYHYHIWKVDVNKALTDKYYLYYYLKYYTPKWMGLTNGSVMMHITKGSLEKQLIRLPDLNTQRQIASILSSLDDKIAVNKKICENLEAQAQALFKHWFVDFAPFKDGKFVESELGLIPEGWRVCTLEEICKCELGGTPSRAKKSYWGGNIAWINSGEVNKFRICEASEFITEDGLNHSATKLLPAKTTVLAITGATLGQVSLLEIDSCANQSVVGVKENETIPYTFIYPAIKCNINKLVNMQTGGAQQHINKDNIQSLQIIEAPKNIMEEYKLLTLPLYEEIGILCFENLRLATLRDTLLPKLMSGQIKMNEIAL